MFARSPPCPPVPRQAAQRKGRPRESTSTRRCAPLPSSWRLLGRARCATSYCRSTGLIPRRRTFMGWYSPCVRGRGKCWGGGRRHWPAGTTCAEADRGSWTRGWSQSSSPVTSSSTAVWLAWGAPSSRLPPGASRTCVGSPSGVPGVSCSGRGGRCAQGSWMPSPSGRCAASSRSFARSYWTERSCRPWRGRGAGRDGRWTGRPWGSRPRPPSPCPPTWRARPCSASGTAEPRRRSPPPTARRGRGEGQGGGATRRAGGTGSDRWCAVREAGH
mmetsp:Transcript_5670/g.19653  ORF Transcript_5670/g.19653 Transcript_5670/m.19653 type:complete len:273 (-) Transcript_5670:1134-1952(-)